MAQPGHNSDSQAQNCGAAPAAQPQGCLGSHCLCSVSQGLSQLAPRIEPTSSPRHLLWFLLWGCKSAPASPSPPRDAWMHSRCHPGIPLLTSTGTACLPLLSQSIHLPPSPHCSKTQALTEGTENPHFVPVGNSHCPEGAGVAGRRFWFLLCSGAERTPRLLLTIQGCPWLQTGVCSP